MTKPKRGGARPNSGRPKLNRTVIIRVTPDERDKIIAERKQKAS